MINFEQMLEHLSHAKAGDLFLMQGYCHNPTGADMTADQFDALFDVLDGRGVIPWIDLAYLGFAHGWEADSDVARKIADRFDECIVCITLSKSFGIYRDRANALFVKPRPADKSKMQRAVSAIVRSGASHAPDHGPSVVRTIMSYPKLKNMWLDDLETMRLRVRDIRQNIVQTERSNDDADILGYIGTQFGMFSLLPITAEQEHVLTRDHGVHVVQGGRVNVARLKADDISTLINATHDVLGL